MKNGVWTLATVPAVVNLNAVRGRSVDDVYVVGNDGVALHFNPGPVLHELMVK